MSVGDKSVVFLLGAGCSYDAGVPISKDMIKKLESLLDDKQPLKDLYEYVKYTMEYGFKLTNQETEFNIESLLITLHLLEENKKARLYPFITGYSNNLLDVAGDNYKNVTSLIELIQEELPKWVTLSSYHRASYYNRFEKFQKEYNFALRVFSLNYDLCLEKNCGDSIVETGFWDDQQWDGNRFLQAVDEETTIYLYKLHGSINWERTNNELIISQQQGIVPDIIFGTDLKMQSIDPYLFYLYEFRKYLLSAEVIIVIGYSFNDAHINDLIRQAMIRGSDKKLITVGPVNDNENEKSIDNEKIRIGKKINLEEPDNIIIEDSSAKEFLNNTLSVKFIEEQLPSSDLPF